MTKAVRMAFAGMVGFIAILFLCPAAQGGIPYAKRVVGEELRRTISVDSADIDLDGDIDLLGASRLENSIAWWENDGQQNFTEHVITSAFEGAYFIDGVDVDGDGDTDVLAAARMADLVVWFDNEGDGHFSERVVGSSFGAASCVHGLDMDGDGDIDVLAVAEADDKISWFENNGRQWFIQRVVDDDFAQPRFAVACDLDIDGDMDIVACSYDSAQVAWFENDGSMHFTKQLIAYPFPGANMVMPADMDGDGDIDLVGAGDTAKAIKWWENDGQMNWIGHTLASDANGALAVYPADVNLDGHMDVVAAVYWDDDVLLFYNDGYQNFSKETLDTNFDGAHSILPLDLDADGDIDVVAGAYKYSSGDIKWYENRIVSISADAAGNRKEAFGATETVYGRTRGLELADGTYPMYVVRHFRGWNSLLNQPIPSRVDFPGTFNDPLSDIDVHNGNIGLPGDLPDLVWPAPPGEIDLFDIVVDINRDGDYDPPVDLLDADFAVPFGFSLPVQLSRFTATRQNNGILLSWQTESEQDNLGFELQLREEESAPYFVLASYRQVSELVGAGQSDSPITYEYLHTDPPTSPVLYYRLVQIDASGARHEYQPIEIYSDLNDLIVPQEFNLLPVYPNPFNDQTIVAFELPDAREVTVQLVDVLGRTVREVLQANLTAGIHRVPVDAAGLSSGIYLVRVQAGSQNTVGKLLLLR